MAIIALVVDDLVWQCEGESSYIQFAKSGNAAMNTIPESSPDDILVDDFDRWRSEKVVYYERKNSLGYYHGTWAKRPSYTLISKSDVHRRGDRGKALILSYGKTSGWCGWYTLLGGLDASGFNTLSFWVKGGTGGERFDVGFIDGQRKQFEIDAVYAGPVHQFLDGEITSEWTNVKIPLSRITTEIDSSDLSAVIFWFRYEGEGTIYVDDMIFTNDPNVAQLEETNFPRAKVDLEHPRSLWIWKADPVINRKAAKDIFKLCQYASFERIYLYLSDFEENQNYSYKKELKKFLKESQQRGITVNVLHGHPTWAFEDNHEIVLNWLKGVLEFNKTSSKESRFGGIVLDIEPYLVEDWNVNKESIKTDYLKLLQQCRQLIDAYPQQEFTFSSIVPVFYNHEGDFFSEILKQCDYVSVMDYFDSANAIIDNADYYLNQANDLEKKVTIAVEVQDLVNMRQGSKRNTFFEEGWAFMEQELRKVRNNYQGHPGFGGFEVHCYYAYRHLQKELNAPRNRLRLEMAKHQVHRINTYQTTLPMAIDGRLDEWKKYPPIKLEAKGNVVYGQDRWMGPEDISSTCYSAWDKNTLYFAFDIDDDRHVVEDRGKEIWQSDHVELWLDIDLGADFTESINSKDDFQFGFSPGNFKDISPEVVLWTSNLKHFDDDKVEIAAAKKDNGYSLELAVPREVLYNEETVPMSMTDVIFSPSMHTERLLWYTQKNTGTPPTRFFEGYRMGISMEASDTDDSEIPQKCLMSSSLNRIWGDPTTFGFLEFKGPIAAEKQAQDRPFSQDKEERETAETERQKSEISDGDDPPQITDRLVEKEYPTGDVVIIDEPYNSLTKLKDIPRYPPRTKLSGEEFEFAYRGRISSFQLRKSKALAQIDKTTYFDPLKDTVSNEPSFTIKDADSKSFKIEYRKMNLTDFCGGYVIINGDLSRFNTLTFLIKGEKGKETFEIGMHDIISHRREDAVFCGSIYRYLPNGITADWQLVKIPLEDFYGPDMTKIFSLVLRFNEIGNGRFWIDEIRFSKDDLTREKKIKEQPYLLLHDFDHSNLNLLGRKTSTYKKLPSYCTGQRVENPAYGAKGRSLRLSYKKDTSGWCGFYSLLNEIDGDYYDLSPFKSVSFMVKGEKGGETFELGMADKNWLVIGDSLKAGKITKYLPDGVSTEWQKVTIPLNDFGKLNLSQMGSFVINFHKKGEGTIYIDHMTFHL